MKCRHTLLSLLSFGLAFSLSYQGFDATAQEPAGKPEMKEPREVSADFFRKEIYDYKKNPNEWVYQGELPAIIDFYADWCGPCRQLSPKLKELQKKYPTQLRIWKVNIDKEPELAAFFGIETIPTLLFVPLKETPYMAQGNLPMEYLEDMMIKIGVKDTEQKEYPIQEKQNMTTVTFKNEVKFTLNGKLPAVGTVAPDFKGVKSDLRDLSLSDLKGKRVVLNIFPSLDTGVCAASVRKFNQLASEMDNAEVLCISKDLPFAHARFCTAEGLSNVTSLSAFRCDCFEKAYGLLITDGPMRGLLARAVVVVDEEGKVIYQELVPEITQEPDYEKALAALKR